MSRRQLLQPSLLVVEQLSAASLAGALVVVVGSIMSSLGASESA